MRYMSVVALSSGDTLLCLEASSLKNLKEPEVEGVFVKLGRGVVCYRPDADSVLDSHADGE